MTTTTVELNQEEKRAKIAEALGFTDIRIKESEADDNYGEQYLAGRKSKCGAHHAIPDYFNDLNAIAQAETQAPQEYAAILRVIVAEAHHIKADDADCLSDNAFVKATAAQPAEAFGRTLNLW